MKPVPTSCVFLHGELDSWSYIILNFRSFSMGSRVAIKRVALLIGTPKLRIAKGVPIVFLLLSGSRSGTQYFADLFGRVPLLDLSKKIAKIYQKKKMID